MTHPEMHIVVPGPLDQRTGGYIYDARMVVELRRLGWKVTVHNLDGEFPDADVRARDSLTRTLSGLRDGTRVVIDGLAMGSLPAPVQENRKRLKVLALIHHPLTEETGLTPLTCQRLRELESEALAACRGVLVTSEFSASQMETFGVPACRVRAVQPGTDSAPAAVGPGPQEPPRLLCVASVIPRKGHDVLVRALARLRDTRWTCVCVGSLWRVPEHAKAIVEQTKDADLDTRVQFLGECESSKLDALYDSSSIFVLPSYYEGYGMVLSEALARGLPVVSTTGGAIPHAVPANAGILVCPGDDEALSEALAMLLSSSGRARRAELSTAARRHAGMLPDWEQAAKAFAVAALELTCDRSPG